MTLSLASVTLAVRRGGFRGCGFVVLPEPFEDREAGTIMLPSSAGGGTVTRTVAIGEAVGGSTAGCSTVNGCAVRKNENDSSRQQRITMEMCFRDALNLSAVRHEAPRRAALAIFYRLKKTAAAS